MIVACLLLSSSPAAAQVALVAAAAPALPASDRNVMARIGQKVTLYGVLVIGKGAKARYYSDAPALSIAGRRIGTGQRLPMAALGKVDISWTQVEPYPHHVHLPPPNADNPAYSNAILFGPSHGKWLGFDKIEYHESPIAEATRSSLEVTQATPTDANVNVHHGLGTMRYKVTFRLPGGEVVASLGAESVDRQGISARVMRVSFRDGDDLPGYLTAYYNVPNVFGSSGAVRTHQTELFQGADCADVITGALRAAGSKAVYSSVAGLFAIATPVSPILFLDDEGIFASDHRQKGDPVAFEFGRDVRRGDIMLIDYVGFSDSPRTWDHVAVVSADQGKVGKLDPEDLIMHMGYLYGLVEAEARSEGPALVQFLRLKPAFVPRR